jgi:hypothetical protein
MQQGSFRKGITCLIRMPAVPILTVLTATQQYGLCADWLLHCPSLKGACMERVTAGASHSTQGGPQLSTFVIGLPCGTYGLRCALLTCTAAAFRCCGTMMQRSWRLQAQGQDPGS